MKNRSNTHLIEIFMGKHNTSDGLAILGAITGNDPKMLTMISEETEKLKIAKTIFTLRNQAGLTQTKLARRIGTSKSVISRLEDASYERYSLSLLQRVARALNNRVEVRFVPLISKPPPEPKT